MCSFTFSKKFFVVIAILYLICCAAAGTTKTNPSNAQLDGHGLQVDKSTGKTPGAKSAVAVLGFGKPLVSGRLIFQQSSPNDPVTINGEIKGLRSLSMHGFHIHEKAGDIKKSCETTGAHFNPGNAAHGAPMNAVRHVGDLGNIIADSQGKAKVYLVDKVISLFGSNSIIGRSLILHADRDDLGNGNSPFSKTTGNSGIVIACGEIVAM